MTADEIRDYLGADSLGYLEVDSMVRATGLPRENFCMACFTGDYPTHLTDKTQVEQPQHQLSLLAEAS